MSAYCVKCKRTSDVMVLGNWYPPIALCPECAEKGEGLMADQPTHIIGDDGDIEKLCEHGIGHGGVHTCDLCCGVEGFYDE